MRLSIFSKLFLSHFAAIVLVSGSVGSYFYFSAIDNLMQALRSRLQNSAALISQGLDITDLDQIREAGDMATPVYRRYVESLRAFANANPDIAFIYVMRKEGDRVSFVLDSDADQPAVAGEEYPHRIPAMLEGFVRPSVDKAITRDRWGYFLSGYSPLKSGVGQYLVGIDMYADKVQDKFEQIRLAGLLSLTFSLLLAAIFSSLLSRNFTRRIRNLSQRFTAVTPIDATAIPVVAGDELDQLSTSFDFMASQLAVNQRSLQHARDELEKRVDDRTVELVRANDSLLEEIAERRRVEQRLEAASRTDYLTGVLNRRAMTRRLEQLAGRPGLAGGDFCVILMDIDHFKQVNDSHGHDAGDQVLLRIVEEMRLGLRETDELARWGGEEFLLLLPQTTVSAAASLAERLCSQLAEATIDLAAQRLTVTGSFGVAQYRSGEDLDACLKRADEALYAAKAQGRNRVVTAQA